MSSSILLGTPTVARYVLASGSVGVSSASSMSRAAKPASWAVSLSIMTSSMQSIIAARRARRRMPLDVLIPRSTRTHLSTARWLPSAIVTDLEAPC